MKTKRIYVMMLASSLCMTSIPVSASTVTTVSNSGKEVLGISEEIKSTDNSMDQQLTKILVEVKKKISVPKDCAKFESTYYGEREGYGKQWNLYWYKEDGSHSLRVLCDESGNILDLSEQVYDRQEAKTEVKYLIEELRPIADAFIKKTAQELTGHLNYQTATYLGNYNNCYQFEYIRIENGIPMPDNSITVQVSAVDKKVYQYSANWAFDLKIPEKNIQLSKEQAAQKIKSQVTMELKYLTKWNEDGSRSAYLVYMPSQNYIAIDAKTGEVYTTRQEWYEFTTNEDNKADGAVEQESSTLTKEELAQIEELGNLISREQAIEKITKNSKLYLDQNATAITATLSQYRGYGKEGQKQYIWNISIRDPREIKMDGIDSFRAYSNAGVDAKTGEIISFYANVKSADQMSPEELEAAKKKASKEQCLAIFEAFAKSQNAKQFASTKQSSVVPDYVYDYIKELPVYGGYAFHHIRTNENIPYEDNYFSGSVDAITGKVIQYQKSWDTAVKFESSKNAMTKDQAFEKYIQLEGYELVYEINTIHKIEKKEIQEEMYLEEDTYTVELKPRLVYRTNIYPSMISPFTGKQMNWNGEEYQKESTNLTQYTDIKGNQYERSILLLRDLGAGGTDPKFRPKEAITSKELTSMAEGILSMAWNEEYQLKDSSFVTRQQMAKYGVWLLGYDGFAKIGDIFRCGYADDAKIGKEYYNYVAIAKGLGFFDQKKDKNFAPTEKLTRGEAADLIIRILNSRIR